MILTKKQEKVWQFVRSFYKRYGQTPTYSEIRKKTKLGYSCIQAAFKILEENGLVKKKLGKRGIILKNTP